MPLTLPIGVVLFLFGRVFLFDEQLAFRDAGHFYYPYFQLQFQEWHAGHLPLWNPNENGGEPLLGNPTASLFYPGKLLFLLPYPLAYKLYLVGHALGAVVTSYAAARYFGASRTAASLAGLSYGACGFVLFQVYNIIYLVGGAWLPLALVFTYRLSEQATVARSVRLALVLALMILGGDPQSAQMVLVVAGVSFLLQNVSLRKAIFALLGFAAVGYVLVHLAPSAREFARQWIKEPSAAFAWQQVETATPKEWGMIAVGIAAVGLLVGALRWTLNRSLALSGSFVLLSGLLAFGLAAVQILPTAEFASLTGRASPDVPSETVAFSLHPARLAELVYSGFWGCNLPINTRWFPWANDERSVWVPNLYAGLAPLLFALTAFRCFKGPSIDRWLTGVTLVSLFLAFGKFGDFTWIWTASGADPVHPLNLAPGDKLHGTSTGLYWLAEQIIPGFASFRYPSKLFVFTSAGLALLAARGMDRFLNGERSTRLLALMGVGGSLGIFVPIAAGLAAPSWPGWIESMGTPASGFGPFQVDAALAQLWISLLATMVVAGLITLALLASFQRRELIPLAGVSVLLITAADLLLAHRSVALTVPTSDLHTPSKVMKIIADHHQANHPGEPFRVHRTRLYEPVRFLRNSSKDRVAEQIRWEHDTAQPKYGIPWGIAYAKTEGAMTLYDVEFFFAPWVVPTPQPLAHLTIRTKDRMVYFPRVGFDLWNTRYFVLPKQTILDDVERGSFTLLTDRAGQPLPLLDSSPADADDYIVLENKDARPRAWIVHSVDLFPEIHHLRRADRDERMERLLYRSLDGGLPLWQGQPYGDYPIDLRAQVETDDPALLKELHDLPGPRATSSRARIVSYQNSQVVIEATLDQKGLLVLADTFFPGWKAEVDGQETPILRTNRAMRGLLLNEGNHHIVFRYEPASFRYGAALSGVTFLLTIGLAWRTTADRGLP